jgi:hypothetical protein
MKAASHGAAAKETNMERNTTSIAERPSTAAAKVGCWDFTELEPETKYRIGHIFNTKFGTVELKHYLLNGKKVAKDEALATSTNTQIAGAGSPELRTYLINCHVEPKTPLSKVTFRFGHLGPDGHRHANIGVNGDLREISDSVTSVDGEVLGDAGIGTVQVVVTLDTPPGNHEKGSVELRALTGTIEKFTLGGVQVFLRDVCMTT